MPIIKSRASNKMGVLEAVLMSFLTGLVITN